MSQIAATIIPSGVLLRRLVSSVLVDISDGDSLLRIFDGKCDAKATYLMVIIII